MLDSSLVPRPVEEEEKGPSTHCVRMCYFPSKSLELIFLSAYLSVNMNLDLRHMPKNHFYWAKDIQFNSSYHKQAASTEEQ